MGRADSRSRSRSRSESGGKRRRGGKRETGTINTWNSERQFGFVSCKSTNRADLFIHSEYFENTEHRNKAKTRGLRRGDKVSFEIEEAGQGKRSSSAVNAELLEEAGGRSRSRSRSPSRRRSRSAPKKASIEFRPGDWQCLECKFHNFARNTTCMKCNSPKDGAQGKGDRRRSRSARSRSRGRGRGRKESRSRSPSRRKSASRRKSPSRRRSPSRKRGKAAKSRSRSDSRRR